MLGGDKLNLATLCAAGLFLLLFSGGIVYLERLNHKQAIKTGAADGNSSQSASFWGSNGKKSASKADVEKIKSKVPVAQSVKPDFEFYSLLPEFRVHVERHEQKAAIAEKPSTVQVKPEVVASVATKKAQPAPTIEATNTAPAPAQVAVIKQATQQIAQAAITTKTFVQAGSFASYDDASSRWRQVKSLGIPSNIVEATVNGKNYYRVTIGPISNPSLITEVRNRLYNSGIEHIVKR